MTRLDDTMADIPKYVVKDYHCPFCKKCFSVSERKTFNVSNIELHESVQLALDKIRNASARLEAELAALKAKAKVP